VYNSCNSVYICHFVSTCCHILHTRSTLPSIPLAYVNRVPGYPLAGIKTGCVRCSLVLGGSWQATLCHPMWQVTFGSF